ncbi:hypothetical protein PP180_13050 [Muricauda sp. SK9]|uniref:hypothetical protein n=1 Tax=Flavobacteriaceae TaxID=49546 RepID=UPI0011C3BCCA|nr:MULTISPECIES: hypothetical protein [Allomuricauda]MDC6386305.1 hypothetical protein [Muricauda sp. SK9]
MNFKLQTCLVLLCIQFVSGQNSPVEQENTEDYLSSGYYEVVYKADSLFLTRNYRQSFELLHGLFQKMEPINMYIYYELETYTASAYKVGNKEIAYENLQNLVSEHGLTWRQIKKDSILSSIALESGLDSLRFMQMRKTYEATINMDLREQIRQMKRSDQLYRGKSYMENLEKQDSIDISNGRALKVIFEKYGYPGKELIGHSTAEERVMMDPILLHMKDSVMEHYFLPKLLEFVKKGTCDPKTYGAVADKLTMMKSLDQSRFYGTFRGMDERLPPVEVLNRNRKSIGLPRYGYEEWRFNYLYKRP